MPVIKTLTLLTLFLGCKLKKKKYIEIALRSENNLLQSWPARRYLTKFKGWEVCFSPHLCSLSHTN